MKTIIAIVRGRVQGVFFRKYTRQEAEKLNVKGYVQNLPDYESVKIVAQGENAEKLIQWARTKGSPSSKVESVETRIEEQNPYDTFSVRY
ncbi:MAG: acylphosphatase [Candidatus Hermodarchaeota archaeon]